MKGKERNLHGESKKDSREGDPCEIARQHIPGLSELGQAGEIEGAVDKINAEKGQQHGDAAKKSVEEELGGGPIAFFASPYLY